MSKYALLALTGAMVILIGCAKKSPLTPATPWADVRDDALCFLTTSTDPGNLKVQYIFDWGNGDTTTTSLYKSGDTACCPRSFPDTGTFHIKVKARNEQGRASKWSDECLFHASRPPQLVDTIVGLPRWAVDRWYRPSVKVMDPDGDSVSVKFIWSDSLASGWSPFVASGSTVTDSVKWQTTDRRVVRVVLKDKGSMVSQSATVKSVNVSQMAVLWYAPGDPESYCSSATVGILDGTPVLYTATDEAVECRDLDGRLRWRTEGITGGEFSPSLSPDGLRLYVGYIVDGLVSLNAKTGQIEWFLPLGFVYCTPTVGPGGALYVTTSGDTCSLYRVRDLGDTAQVEWQLPFGNNLSNGAAVGGSGVIYVVARGTAVGFDALVAIDSAGTIVWRDTTHLVRSPYDLYPPVIDSRDRLLVGDASGNLFCFNPDGSVAWSRSVGDLYPGGLTIGYDDRVTFYDWNSSSLTCLDSSGGSLWSTRTGYDGSLNTPCVAQDSTTVSFDEGSYLTGIGPDGGVPWEFSIWDSLGLDKRRAKRDEGEDDPSPLIGPDGNIYVAGGDGFVCIACGDIRLANTAWPTYNHDNARSGWAGRQQR
jgi:hypothetical protein